VAKRTARQYGFRPDRAIGKRDDRAVFVVGSPRSGTSFTAGAIGSVPGFADLGEVNAVKAIVPFVFDNDIDNAAKRLRHAIVLAQRLGMVAPLRPIEQTPESTFVMPALAAAFPFGRFVHLIRDCRDVVCSLIERGWLRDGSAGSVRARATNTTHDDAGNPFGQYARFWVEPERRAEFEAASEATRCAWAWRRYTQAALDNAAELPAEMSWQVRYENMAQDPNAAAGELAVFLDAEGRRSNFEHAIGMVHPRSVGRWEKDLSDSQLAEIAVEAGDLMETLGYV
jgi:hypothetical protein